jgi:hypothetical protein
VLGTSRGFGDILLHRAQRGRQRTGLCIDDPRSSLLQMADVGSILSVATQDDNSKVAAITWECGIGSPSRNSTNIPVLVEIQTRAFWTTAKSRSWPRRWQFARAHWLIDSRGHPGPHPNSSMILFCYIWLIGSSRYLYLSISYVDEYHTVKLLIDPELHLDM